MKLSNQERETICLFNEAEGEAEIYTYNPAMQKQLAALCERYPTQAQLTQQGESGSMTFRIPKKWLRVVPPRVLTPAQREVLERMNAKRHGG